MVLDVEKVSNVRMVKTSLSLTKMRYWLCAASDLEDEGETWWWGKGKRTYTSIAWKWRKCDNRLILELMNEAYSGTKISDPVRWQKNWCWDRKIGVRDFYRTEPVETSYAWSPVAASDSLEPLVWGLLFVPNKEAGNFLLMKSSFPEQNGQFLPGSLQLWAVASR